VPSRLIGAKLLARLYENRIVLLEGRQEVAQLPHVLGAGGAVINVRHIIGHLLRKPGAFANYRWREELFPAPAYRALYDQLVRTTPEADRRYLEVLKVAADEGITAVENALEQLLGAPRAAITAVEVRGMLDSWREIKEEWRARPPLEVCLEDYDALLGAQEAEREPTPENDTEVAF
jgi:hypothetical protein